MMIKDFEPLIVEIIKCGRKKKRCIMLQHDPLGKMHRKSSQIIYQLPVLPVTFLCVPLCYTSPSRAEGQVKALNHLQKCCSQRGT